MADTVPIVDPRFGDELRRLRTEREHSLRELARRVHYGKSHIHHLETGQARATAEIAARLDAALTTGATLAAMVSEPDYGITPDHQDRLAAVAARPRILDLATVDALAGILARTRRLEDAIGAEAVLVPVTAQLAIVDTLMREARGPARVPLVDIAAQWAQAVEPSSG